MRIPCALPALALAFLTLAPGAVAGSPGEVSPEPAAIAQDSDAPEEAGEEEAEEQSFEDRVDYWMSRVNYFISGGDDGETEEVENALGFFHRIPLFGLTKPDGSPIEVPLLVFWLVLGAIFFTVRMGFINLREPSSHAIKVVRWASTRRPRESRRGRSQSLPSPDDFGTVRDGRPRQHRRRRDRRSASAAPARPSG